MVAVFKGPAVGIAKLIDDLVVNGIWPDMGCQLKQTIGYGGAAAVEADGCRAIGKANDMVAVAQYRQYFFEKWHRLDIPDDQFEHVGGEQRGVLSLGIDFHVEINRSGLDKPAGVPVWCSFVASLHP